MEEKRKITITPENTTYSGHEMVIIPSDPKYSPNDQQISDCLDLLKREFPQLIIVSENLFNVEFMDCGQNFESVNCNLCGKEMDMEFWQEQMSNAYDNTNFKDLTIVTECCKKKTNLNDLKYHGDCGFSSYYLTINNAEPNEDIEKMINHGISRILGTEIKVFWRNI